MMLRPYKFRPLFRTLLWGGARIAPFKGMELPCPNVGESWELSGVAGRESVVDGGPDDGLTVSALIGRHGAALMGERALSEYGDRFPLLVKLIDARRDLSVQVHPGDELARRLHGGGGKSEMWYVIDHEPGAQILAGFKRAITPEEFDRRVGDGTIVSAIARHRSRRGDVFFLPAGCIHAIGAGNLIAEIQQTSDVTYRIHDYGRLDADGRPRPLHTALARQALDFALTGDRVANPHVAAAGATAIVACDRFVVHRLLVDGELALPLPDGFLVMMCVGGELLVEDGQGSTPLSCGHTLLIPACLPALTLRGKATLLTAHLP